MSKKIEISQELPKASLFSGATDYILSVLALEKTGIKHIAIGIGAPTDTKLGDERGRRGILEVIGAAPGSIERVWRAYFEPDYPALDLNISEVGLFGDSTSTKDSGVGVAYTSLETPVLKRAGIDSLWVNYKLFYPV